MAAHKKGQAHPGPYTDAKTHTTDHPDYDAEGYLRGPNDHSAELAPASDRTNPRYIAPITGGPGLSDSLPKGFKGKPTRGY